MDLKAYYLEYKNIPWYYGVCTNNLVDARESTHKIWEQMCIREPIKLTIPPMENYDQVFDDDDDYD